MDNYRIGFVELPLAADKKPISWGETVYGEDGLDYKITAVGTAYVFGRHGNSKQDKRLLPEWLVHKQDTWESLREFAISTGNRDCREVFDRALNLAMRH